MRCCAVIGALVLFALAAPRTARAETVVEAHGRALHDYYAGRYDRAAEALERVLAIPLRHETVHYNLGCAYFRLHKLGPAIFHFERALVLDPGDEDARFNLDIARGLAAARVKDEIKGATGEAWWVRFVSILGERTWVVLLLTLWWVTCAILLALRYLAHGPARAALVAGNSLLAVATLIAGLAVAGRLSLGGRVATGIVLPDDLAVREGPGAATKVSFTLHAGLRVRLQVREEGWVRIRLPNGLEGWAPTREIGVL